MARVGTWLLRWTPFLAHTPAPVPGLTCARSPGPAHTLAYTPVSTHAHVHLHTGALPLWPHSLTRPHTHTHTPFILNAP